MRKIFCIIFSVAFLFASIAHAEIKTCTGVGDYVLSEDSPPGDIKNKAKMYAEQNALEQAGVFVSGLTVVKNHMVSRDEIITIVGGILKIIDIKFEIIPINDVAGIAKYRATVIAEIDTKLLDEAIKKWLSHDGGEKANLVEKTKSQQKTIEDLQKRIIELEKLAAKITTVQEKEEIQEKVSEIDKETLSAQKVDEAWNLCKNGKFSEAVPVLNEAVKLNSNNSDAYRELGWAYTKLGDHNKALFYRKKAVELNPDDLYAVDGIAWAYNELKEYENAIKICTKGIELHPEFEPFYHTRGISYYELKNYSQAVLDFTKAIELKSNQAWVYNSRGWAYGNLNYYSQAISDYKKSIELDPNSANPYDGLGWIYNCLGEYKNAIYSLNKAIQLNPKHCWAYEKLGRAYYGLKQYQKAISYCDKSIEINQNDRNYFWAYVTRGDCYRALGENEKAEKDFAKARQLGWDG